ncbi:Fimbrial protein [uncultured bacterium]|nr:Fimbrial protein [uncultured bacterium]
MQQKNKNTGFTLIELMIVIAIISILAGISYPLYNNYMIKARRADAKAALLELSTWMERYYTAKGCYSVPDSNGACTTNPPTLPFTVTPKSGVANYNLFVCVSGTSCNSVTVTIPTSGFILVATPIKTEATCSSLTLDNTGVKGESGTGTVADCW